MQVKVEAKVKKKMMSRRQTRGTNDTVIKPKENVALVFLNLNLFLGC